MDYWGAFFCKISNGKQRYFIKKNKHVSKLVSTYKSSEMQLKKNIDYCL